MDRAQATGLAAQIFDRLAPYCKPDRIQVVGSIRRQKPFPRDIDMVLIPSDPWNLEQEILALARPFRPALSGDKLKRFSYNGVQVDLYFATEETWATLLLIRTGSTQHNIRLCSLAKKKGWHLAASGDGLFNQKGQRVAGDTEESIYAALGLPFQPPEERG